MLESFTFLLGLYHTDFIFAFFAPNISLVNESPTTNASVAFKFVYLNILSNILGFGLLMPTSSDATISVIYLPNVVFIILGYCKSTKPFVATQTIISLSYR